MNRVRDYKTHYRTDPPIRRAWFVTAEDDDGNYPLSGHGCNVMPCRFAHSVRFTKEDGPQSLTKTPGERFAWVWTGRWIPPGTYFRALHLYGRWWANENSLAKMSLRGWDDSSPANREWYRNRFGGVKLNTNNDVFTMGAKDGTVVESETELYLFNPSGEVLQNEPLGQLISAGGFDVDENDNVYVFGTGPGEESVGVNVTGIEKYDSSFSPGWYYNKTGVAEGIGVYNIMGIRCVRAGGGLVVTGEWYTQLNPATSGPIKIIDDSGSLVTKMNPYAAHNPFPNGPIGPGNYDCFVQALDFAPGGLIIAGGSYCYATYDSSRAGSLFCLDPSQEDPLIWASGTIDQGGVTDLKVDGNHIYVTHSVGVAKYTLDGQLVWHMADWQTYGTHVAIDLDDAGNIYACGTPTVLGPLGRSGGFNMIKLDNDGNILFKLDIFSSQNDIAVNRSTQKFYTTGGEVEDYA